MSEPKAELLTLGVDGAWIHFEDRVSLRVVPDDPRGGVFSAVQRDRIKQAFDRYNAHDELVAALREAREIIGSLVPYATWVGPYPQAMAKINAALALADHIPDPGKLVPETAKEPE